MKKISYTFIIGLFILTYSCGQKTEEINLGESALQLSLKKDSTLLILDPNSNLLPPNNIIVKNINYRVLLDSKEKVYFISTMDSNFILNDSIKVDFYIKDLKNKKIEHRKGWGYYTKVTPKWFAFLSPDKKPVDSIRIKSFFKFNFPKKNKSRFFDY